MPIPRKAGAAPGFRHVILPAAAVLLATVLACPPVVASSDTQSRIKAKAADLARVKAKIASVTQALAADHGKQGRLQAAVEAAERKVHDARAQLADVTAQVKAEDARLVKAEAQRKKIEADLRARKTVLASQMRAAYMMESGSGSDSRLQLLLSGEDPGLVARMLGYYGYLGRARGDAIEGVKSRLQKAAALEQQIDDRRQRLAGLKDRSQAALHKLDHDQKARAAAVRQLKARIADRSQHLADLHASEQQIETLIQSLRGALANEPYELGNHRPFAKLKGRLPWPVHGKLLARFGQDKAGGALHWKGLWIAASADTPVRASAHGRVVYVGWISSYGLLVLLQHDHGYFTLYGHAASADVKVGEWVDAGQVIARVGKTGGYDRDGLYFEIRHGHDALDPRHWLAR